MRFASGKDVSGVISGAHGCVIAAPAESSILRRVLMSSR
jgi:hypothetical protein